MVYGDVLKLRSTLYFYRNASNQTCVILIVRQNFGLKLRYSTRAQEINYKISLASQIVDNIIRTRYTYTAES